MQGRTWLAVVLTVGLVTVAPPLSGAAGDCEDTVEQRSGALKWAVLSVVFSASTAIATRTTDVELQGGECVLVSITCVARAADNSALTVIVHPGGSSYSANFKGGPLSLNDGTGTCPHARSFEGTDGVLRVLFEG